MALALIYGIRQFDKYLAGRHLTLSTGHRSIVKILGSREGVPTLAAARLQRWALILSAYQYTLQCSPDNLITEADLLSRLPLQVKVNDLNENTVFIDYCEMLPLTANEIKMETKKDPILRRVFQYTIFGWPQNIDPMLEQYGRRKHEFSIENICLLWASRVVIPHKHRPRILGELHENHYVMKKIKR